jgi:RNA polymerase sigma factor (sigma-70 family)
MSGDLVPYDDINDRQERGAISITAVTKLKHADLFAAAKKFEHGRKSKKKKNAPGQYGGQSAMARKLKVPAAELGKWINLQACPPETPRGKWTARRLVRLEAALLKITGKSMEELFPKEMRDNIQFLSAPKQFERTVAVEQRALAHYAEATRERMLISQNPEAILSPEEIRIRIDDVLHTFPEREQVVIENRYGLHGKESLTLEEVGNLLGIHKERVRQIEARAVRRFQGLLNSGKANSLREVIDVNFE